MIERKIVEEKMQEFLVQEFLDETFNKVGHSHTEIVKTPVGEKVMIHASRPGLIVGSRGSNIKKLTKLLKSKFKMDNPQIDIIEVKKPDVNAQLVAENIAFQFERYGSQRFKAIGYRVMENAMRQGAMGIEILVSGKVPSTRARTWRFYTGYLKKSGDLAVSGVDTAYSQAKLKTGVVGIQVRIMPGDITLPDKLELYSEVTEVAQDAEKPTNIMKSGVKKDDKAEGKTEANSDEKPKKNLAKKTVTKDESKTAEPAKEKSAQEAEEPAEKPKNLKEMMAAKKAQSETAPEAKPVIEVKSEPTKSEEKTEEKKE